MVVCLCLNTCAYAQYCLYSEFMEEKKKGREEKEEGHAKDKERKEKEDKL